MLKHRDDGKIGAFGDIRYDCRCRRYRRRAARFNDLTTVDTTRIPWR